MVSLVELLNLGEVTWSGEKDLKNEFKCTLSQPKGRLSAFVSAKVGALQAQWRRI